MSKKVYSEEHFQRLKEENAKQIDDAHAAYKGNCNKCPLELACRSIDKMMGGHA